MGSEEMRFFVLVAAVAVVAGCAVPDGQDRRDALRLDGTSLRAESRTALPAGETPEGERLSSPRLVSAAIRSADMLMGERNFDGAAGLYRRAYDARPDLDILVSLSRALRQSGNAQQAVLTLQREDRRHGGRQGFQIELARAALDGGFLAEAEAAVQRALAMPDAGWGAQVMAGVLAARRDDTAGARAAFARAGELARNEAERDAATANTAFLDAMEGHRAEAISALEGLASKPDAQRRVVVMLAALKGLAGDRAGYEETIRRAGLSPAEVEQGRRWLDITLTPPAPERPIPRSISQMP